jgi:hypothetical protein
MADFAKGSLQADSFALTASPSAASTNPWRRDWLHRTWPPGHPAAVENNSGVF